MTLPSERGVIPEPQEKPKFEIEAPIYRRAVDLYAQARAERKAPINKTYSSRLLGELAYVDFDKNLTAIAYLCQMEKGEVRELFRKMGTVHPADLEDCRQMLPIARSEIEQQATAARDLAEKQIRDALATAAIQWHGRPASDLINKPHHMDRLITTLLLRRTKQRNKDIAGSETDLTVRAVDDYASILIQAGLLTRFETRPGRRPETEEFYNAVAQEWRKNPRGSTRSYADALLATGKFKNVTFWTVRDALQTMMKEKNPRITTRRVPLEERLDPAQKIVNEYKISQGRWPTSTELRKRIPELGDWTAKEILRMLARREGRDETKPTDQS